MPPSTPAPAGGGGKDRDGHVGLAVEHGRQEARRLDSGLLEVGVDEEEDLGIGRRGHPCEDRAPLAAVGGQREDLGAGAPGRGDGAVT